MRWIASRCFGFSWLIAINRCLHFSPQNLCLTNLKGSVGFWSLIKLRSWVLTVPRFTVNVENDWRWKRCRIFRYTTTFMRLTINFLELCKLIMHYDVIVRIVWEGKLSFDGRWRAFRELLGNDVRDVVVVASVQGGRPGPSHFPPNLTIRRSPLPV